MIATGLEIHLLINWIDKTSFTTSPTAEIIGFEIVLCNTLLMRYFFFGHIEQEYDHAISHSIESQQVNLYVELL